MGAMKYGFSAWSGMLADIRDAFRSLRRSGAFTAWVVGSLAIGMAVAIAALALLNAALLLPFQGVTDQDRLVRVSVSENCGRPDCWRRMFSPDDYRALQEGLRSVQGLAAYGFGDVSAGVPDARLLRAIVASAPPMPPPAPPSPSSAMPPGSASSARTRTSSAAQYGSATDSWRSWELPRRSLRGSIARGPAAPAR